MNKKQIILNRVPIDWDLDRGGMTFFGLNAATFWLNPSLLRMLQPLAKEVGKDFFRLLIAYHASLGTDEDYHNMVNELGENFENGFLAWGKAVSAAGWGSFEIRSFDRESSTAVVRVQNPWELEMQRGEANNWGCPFLQGKIIGIFNHALGTTCWADESHSAQNVEEIFVDFHIRPSKKTIEDELQILREKQIRAREQVLRQEITQATERLEANESHLKSILSSISDLVFTFDPSGKITDYYRPRNNPDWYPELSEDPAQRHCKIIFPGIWKQLQELIAEIASSNEGRSLEFFQKVGDNPHHFSARFSPLWDATGAFKGVTGILRDVTHAMEMEAQLLRSQKLESIGVLAGGVAHDYNNMLGVILGYVSLLQEEITENPGHSEYLKLIRKAGERGAELSRKLSSISRKKSMDPQPCNINDQIQDDVQILQKALSSRIILMTEIQKDIWPTILDAGDLQDSLMNIAINAMHAMPNGGTFKIATSNQYLAAKQAQEIGLSPGEYVCLSLIDTGFGMSSAVQTKIFDPFFTTKGSDGHGLGLSQVYGFVQRSGGSIDVHSQIDEGTRFDIFFPRYHGDNLTENREQNSDLKETLSGTERILVVDDEPVLANLLCTILRRHGYEVYTALNGEEALAVLTERQIHLVISDIVMPEIDGFQLAEIIRSQYPQVKIQLVSGYSDDHKLSTRDQDLSAKLLQKPIESNLLLGRVRQMLDADS